MIQDIFPHCFNNKFLPNRQMQETDYIFHFSANSLLFKKHGEGFEIPQVKDFSTLPKIPEPIFLFTLNDSACFLVSDQPKGDESLLVFKEISFFRTALQKEIAWITLVGFHLKEWYAGNKFCGKCGNPTFHKPDERALICMVCHTSVYPKISPAIIVAITCKDKILLAHNANFVANWYSLIAGYADIGETLEETVTREVKEEVGLDVKNIRYYKSQPWSLSGSMMIGFVAEADDSQLISIDTKEIADAAWFTRGSLPSYPSNISIAGEMIELFEKGEL